MHVCIYVCMYVCMHVYCMHNLPTYLTQVTLDLEAAAAAHRDVLCVCDTSVPDQCVRHLCCSQVTLDLEAAAAAHRDVLCVCDTSVPDQCVRHLCCSQVTLDLEAAAAAHRDVLLRQHTTHDTDTANTLTVAPLQTFQPVYLQVHMYVWVRVCPHTVWACTQARPLANACTHKHTNTYTRVRRRRTVKSRCSKRLRTSDGRSRTRFVIVWGDGCMHKWIYPYIDTTE